MLRRCLLATSLLLSGAPVRAEPVLRQVFHFAASAPLFARPGVGASGSVYVGSGDGYVHALTADGAFRWSYTVKGRVLAPPVEDPATGRVLVATSEKKLYALEPDAHLRWVFPLPVAPKTELAFTGKGTLLFVGEDDYLYGVTTAGALTLRLAAPQPRSAPSALGAGAGLVLGDTIATLKGYGYTRAPLAGSFEASARLALAPDSAIFACESGKVRVLGAARSFEHESDCLAPPTPAGDLLAVAESGGLVRIFAPDGSSQTILAGGTALRPVWDAARHRLVVASASGTVTVYELTEGDH